MCSPPPAVNWGLRGNKDLKGKSVAPSSGGACRQSSAQNKPRACLESSQEAGRAMRAGTNACATARRTGKEVRIPRRCFRRLCCTARLVIFSLQISVPGRKRCSLHRRVPHRRKRSSPRRVLQERHLVNAKRDTGGSSFRPPQKDDLARVAFSFSRVRYIEGEAQCMFLNVQIPGCRTWAKNVGWSLTEVFLMGNLD